MVLQYSYEYEYYESAATSTSTQPPATRTVGGAYSLVLSAIIRVRVRQQGRALQYSTTRTSHDDEQCHH